MAHPRADAGTPLAGSLMAATGPPFNADFYILIATVIPVFFSNFA